MLPNLVLAQAPPNDDCANAIELCPGTIFSGTTTNATTQCGTPGDPELDCTALGTWGACYDVNNSVWYQFTTDNDGGFVGIEFTNISCLTGSDDEIQATFIVAANPCSGSGLTFLSCQSRSSTNFIFSNSFPPNTTVYVHVDGDDVPGPAAQCDFNIEVSGDGVAQCCIPGLLGLTTSSLNATCGVADGQVAVSPTGGSAPFTYAWESVANPGTIISTNSIVPSLSPGTYSVTVSDNNGCQETATETVVDPGGPSIDQITVVGTTCGDDNGTLNAIVSGGLSPYIYNWESALIPGISIGNTSSITDLSVGTYNLTVSNSDGSCAVTSNAFVNEASPAIDITSVDSNGSSCGDTTGNVRVTISGGTIPVLYNWENLTTGTVVGNTQNINNLLPGFYGVTITNNDGTCAVDTTILVQTTSGGPTVTSVVLDTATCGLSNGGAAPIVIGNDTMYLFSWASIDDPSIIVSTDSAVTGLSAGEYIVGISNSDGTCPVFETIEIPESRPNIDTFAIANEYECDPNSGIAVPFISGGNQPYQYEWNVLDTLGNPIQFFSTDTVATGLYAGDYQLVIIDSTGLCTDTSQVTIFFQPDPVLSTPIVVDEDCNSSNGTATVSVTEGIWPYNYQWINVDSFNTIISTDSVATGLAAGTYNVTVTSADGTCPQEATMIVRNQDGPTLGDTTVTSATCGNNDGTAAIEILGGTYPYNYAWYDVLDPSVVVSTDSVATLPGGTYLVEVTNQNGTCAITETILIPIDGGPVVTGSTTTATACGDSTGTASVDVIGGTGPYVYVWTPLGSPTDTLSTSQTVDSLWFGSFTVNIYNADTTCAFSYILDIDEQPNAVITSIDVTLAGCGQDIGTAIVNFTGSDSIYLVTAQIIGAPFNDWQSTTRPDSTTLIVGLAPGTYEFTISNLDGSCATTDTATILAGPQLTTVFPTVFPTTCGLNNGSASLVLVDGVEPTTIIWQAGSTFLGVGETIENLSPGNYNVQVYDDASCQFNVPFTIEPSSGPTVIASPDITVSLGDTATLFAFPSDSLLQIEWSPASGLSCLECDSLTVLPFETTTYTVEVMDSVGCTAEDQVTVNVEDSEVGFFVPSGFTPNGDNLNDAIFVNGLNVKRIISFSIYDRWGERVFFAEDIPANDPTFGWNGTYRGKELNPGVFVYQVEVEYLNLKKDQKRGEITLVR